MKGTVLTSLLFLLVFQAVAQRVDLDKFRFSVAYRDFPDEPLPEPYKTYNVRIEASPTLGVGYDQGNLEQLVDIQGLKHVTGTGHITVLAMLDDLVIEKADSREREEVKKDKQGVETKKMYYSNELTYSFGARMSVYDYKGNTILSNYILYDRDTKRTYKTPEFGSAEEASGYYTKKVGEIRSGICRQLVNTSLTTMNGILNRKYGYLVQRSNDLLWILNNKRHPSYRDHQKAWNSFREAIILINENDPLDKVREKMQPVIDYFEKVKTKYTTSSKEDRKMRYASYFNLAKIYFYLDEPEKAIREADALSMNDYDESDGRSLRGAAQNLMAVLQKNNATTRHFAVNADSYEPPIR